MKHPSLYRAVWRWHFYAGLFVIPMILILAVTGTTYLFKPQIDRWEERAWQGLPTSDPAAPSAQRDAALAAFPGARFQSYRLPERSGDAAMIHLALVGDGGMRDVFVSPQGRVLGALDPGRRVIAIAQRIHGQLLLGPRGSWLVELAASWAIVMILSGLYLWWPEGGGLAGVAWPRLGRGSRIFWRDLHAVTGFWVAGLALVLLVTGLPWAGVWGSAFKLVREEIGWVKDKQDWTIAGRAPDGGEHALHAAHDHTAMMGMTHRATHPSASLDTIVARARADRLAFPVLIEPASGGATGWTVRSDSQDRTRRVTVSYDASGTEIRRETFADKHPIDRAVGYGISWHEGALFGAANQAIGAATTLMLVMLAVSGFVLWRRRKPAGSLGPPPLPQMPARIGGVTAIVLVLAALLPMLAVSLVAIWLTERLILRRIPAAADWLGLAAHSRSSP